MDTFLVLSEHNVHKNNLLVFLIWRKSKDNHPPSGPTLRVIGTESTPVQLSTAAHYTTSLLLCLWFIVDNSTVDGLSSSLPTPSPVNE